LQDTVAKEGFPNLDVHIWEVKVLLNSLTKLVFARVLTFLLLPPKEKLRYVGYAVRVSAACAEIIAAVGGY